MLRRVAPRWRAGFGYEFLQRPDGYPGLIQEAACPSRPGSPRPKKLWPRWRAEGDELAQAKRDATLLWLKAQEDAGLDIVTRRRAVAPALRARLPRAGRGHRLRAQGEDGHPRQPLRRDGAAGGTGRCGSRAACTRPKRGSRARTPTRKLKFTLPGPMTIVDTVADEHYGDKVKLAMAFAELLNQEARALEADGVDVIQFDEPAFNVYMDDVERLGRRRARARGAGPDLHDRRAHLLRLRHPGQHRLEEDARRRVAPVRGRSSRRSPRAASTRCRSSASTRTCRSS